MEDICDCFLLQAPVSGFCNRVWEINADNELLLVYSGMRPTEKF